MYLRKLSIRNLKLLRELDLDFSDARGGVRRWTVLIGENGTGKTSVLQAAAMACLGATRANVLAGGLVPSLADRRQDECQVEITAELELGERQHGARAYPGRDSLSAPPSIHSRLVVPAGMGDLRGSSSYATDAEGEELDPLINARSGELPHWFVSGYGIHRTLTLPARRKTFANPTSARLRPLFEPADLIGMDFADILEPPVARRFAKLLDELLRRLHFPGILGVELRGRGGVSKAEQLVEGHRIRVESQGSELKLPAIWLSHGYQSSIAWIADLVGQLLLEDNELEDPAQMEGLVLIDEIDLYLHPRWQVSLVRALKETFPHLQFIATTHSPILLTALRPDEVVVLRLDDAGDVRHTKTPRDPRLLTGTDVYASFFGIDRLYPDELGHKLARYAELAVNPFRTEEEDVQVHALRAELLAEDLEIALAPVEREAS